MSTTNATADSAAADAPAAAKPKAKLAIYWAASCGGCEISILGIHEKIVAVGEAFDIVIFPCGADGKVRDVEKLPDGAIDLCLFNGSIRTSEQEYMARLMRAKSKVLVAFGSCAQEGCIPGLGNLHNRKEIFQTNYHDSPSLDNPQGTEPQARTEVPEGTLHLPEFYDSVRTLAQTVEVDYYLPGCPPESERIWEALVAILEGKLPPKGSVIGALSTVCDTCGRKRGEKKISAFKRTWEVIPDAEACLLEQGLICAGPATRAGCGALCPKVNSPCIGCYGPSGDADDFGARLMTALASVIDSSDPAEVEKIIAKGIPDPIGTFYRFSLPGSLLRRKAKAAANGCNGNGCSGNGHGKRH